MVTIKQGKASGYTKPKCFSDTGLDSGSLSISGTSLPKSFKSSNLSVGRDKFLTLSTDLEDRLGKVRDSLNLGRLFIGFKLQLQFGILQICLKDLSRIGLVVSFWGSGLFSDTSFDFSLSLVSLKNTEAGLKLSDIGTTDVGLCILGKGDAVECSRTLYGLNDCGVLVFVKICVSSGLTLELCSLGVNLVL